MECILEELMATATDTADHDYGTYSGSDDGQGYSDQRDSETENVVDHGEMCDPYFKFKLMVEELLTIFTKSEDKCDVCVEYIVKLCQHIGQTHEGSPSKNMIPDIDSDVVEHDPTVHQELEPVTPVQTLTHPEMDDGECEVVFSSLSPPSSSANGTKQIIRLKNYNCNLCWKSFAYLPNLKKHLSTHITEEKRTTTTPSCLTGHKLIHTGEKKKAFKCNECGKILSRRDKLKIHKQIHTGEKLFKCDNCGRRFLLLDYLRAHEKRNNCKKA